MSSRVLSGPWAQQPLTFFASVNAGASAFSVTANTPQQAVAAAASRIYDDVRREVYGTAQAWADGHADCDVFDLDTKSEAEVERRWNAECAKLRIYTPREWDDWCLRDHQAARVGTAS